MILPNLANLRIERAKVVDYLLNPAHPDNGGKATFFIGWGFTTADWQRLADAIRAMAASTSAADVVQSKWGVKYVVDGELHSPHGTTPVVRTVWIVDAYSTTPRLVTAYPRQ